MGRGAGVTVVALIIGLAGSAVGGTYGSGSGTLEASCI